MCVFRVAAPPTRLANHKNPVQEGLLATFGGKMMDPLVVKDSFLRGSPIFSQQVAKKKDPNQKNKDQIPVEKGNTPVEKPPAFR